MNTANTVLSSIESMFSAIVWPARALRIHRSLCVGSTDPARVARSVPGANSMRWAVERRRRGRRGGRSADDARSSPRGRRRGGARGRGGSRPRGAGSSLMEHRTRRGVRRPIRVHRPMGENRSVRSCLSPIGRRGRPHRQAVPFDAWVHSSSPGPARRSASCRAPSPRSRAADLGGRRHQGRARARRRRPRPGRPRDHGPGADGRPGPGAEPPGGGEGRHPDERARRQRQQGLPLRPQRHLPRRPDDRRRRRRHRGGRRHGVDDQRAVPRRRGPRRLPLRQRRAARRDHRRRPVVRVRRRA